jgi:outer membrane protein
VKPHSLLAKILVFVAAAVVGSSAQTPSQKPLSLEDAIQQAVAHYPSIRASLERAEVAQAGISLAKTAYLPAANALWQGNRATRNNIFGQLFPQAVIPPISGPVLPTTSSEGATGSAAGLLLSWEPFDFGYRAATVSAARANRAVSGAEVNVTRLDLMAAVTNAFTSLAAAQQVTRAAQANVDRREVFAKSVHTLVDNQLRPGADASRADAELASARIALIQAQTDERVSLVNLARLLNVAPAGLAIDAAELLDLPPQAPSGANSIQLHPLAVAQNERVNFAASQVSALDRSYVPRFNFQGALSGRGTSANNDGTFSDFSQGFGIQRRNWALGLTATFGLGDFFSIRARKQGAEASRRVEEARYAQTVDDLSGQLAEAQAAFDGARQIAENTPVELRAARDGETQARARYQAGLATAVEVSDAQALLIRAEIDDAVSRLNAWRSLAGIFAAQGDIGPFLDLLRTAHTGGH